MTAVIAATSEAVSFLMIISISGSSEPFRRMANGLRYWRWGGRREAVQTEKATSVEKCLGNALSPQRPVHALFGNQMATLNYEWNDPLGFARVFCIVRIACLQKLLFGYDANGNYTCNNQTNNNVDDRQMPQNA